MFCILRWSALFPHTKKPKSMGDTPIDLPGNLHDYVYRYPGTVRVVPACGGWAAACFYYKKCFCVMRRGLGHLPRPGSLAAGRRLVLAARRGLRRGPAPQWEGAAGTAAVSTTTASLMPCAARRAPRRCRAPPRPGTPPPLTTSASGPRVILPRLQVPRRHAIGRAASSVWVRGAACRPPRPAR